MREIIIRLTDIPDGTGNAGWLCRVHPYSDGDPIGHGTTIREAFTHMLNRIEEQASEKILRGYGNEVDK